jgi:anti-sigma factor RsiW
MFEWYFRNRLAAWNDGQLQPSTSRRMEAHLKRCARCRAELEAVRAAATALRELRVQSAPESLWMAIERGLHEAPAARALQRSWRPYAVAAAALVIASIIAAVAVRGRHEPGWSVVRIGTAGGTSTLGVGQWLVTGPSTTSRVSVGQIGEVVVEPNSRVRLMRASVG